MCAVQELVGNYGTSALFCTATQPTLKQFMPDMPDFSEISNDPESLFTFYKRVHITNLGEISDMELLDRMNAQPQAVCIVNTRNHAQGLFNGLAQEGRFHLSTLMCPAHRQETLAAIRKRLKDSETCRVVSTQVLEAGIDVDFPIGFRALAGLDSIIQAAGRVNREGKNTGSELFVFEPNSEFIKRTPTYIKQTAEVAHSILREFGADPASIEAVKAYFNRLYSLQDEHLAFDVKEILACFDKVDGFNFKKAGEKFNLIENTTVAVLIPYDEDAEEFIKELAYHPYPASVLRKLQSYTVNIYEQEFQSLNEKGVINMVADAYAVLSNTDFYSPETGIVIPAKTGGEAIFFD